MKFHWDEEKKNKINRYYYGGEPTICISSMKTWLTNVDHHRAIQIYQDWEYISTGTIFVISSRFMGLQWPSSQINELGELKRLENIFLGT